MPGFKQRILAGRISVWTCLATGTLSAAVKFVEVLARLASTHTPSCSAAATAAAADKEITLANRGFVIRRLANTHPDQQGHVNVTRIWTPMLMFDT